MSKIAATSNGWTPIPVDNSRNRSVQARNGSIMLHVGAAPAATLRDGHKLEDGDSYVLGTGLTGYIRACLESACSVEVH